MTVTLEELRRLVARRAVRRTLIGFAALCILGSLVNPLDYGPGSSSHEVSDVFAAVNASVLVAMVLAIFGTSGDEYRRLTAGHARSRNRRLGSKARAYGIGGIVFVALSALVVAAVALPILHARHAPSPDWAVVRSYLARESVAALRLSCVGVAIGVLAAGRGWLAGAILAAFLVIEGVAASASTVVRDYGPIGALHAFSDPTHKVGLSLGAASAVALGWALLALIAASVVISTRGARVGLNESA